MASLSVRESSFCDENQSDNTVRSLYHQKQNFLFCDVIMKVCDKKIYAHSNVLAAASPYFNNFLSQDLPRQYSARSPQIIEIQIDGSEPNMLYEEAVESVIDYIYTGRVCINDANVSQISEIARIMQIYSVVNHCEEFLNGKVDNTDVTAPKISSCMVDSSTNTDPIDMMLQYRRQPEVNRMRSHNSKFMTMVSVATQVMPKLLGLRESEKQMTDKGTCTDSNHGSSKKPKEDSRIVHVQLMVDGKVPSQPSRGRGRPKKLAQEITSSLTDITEVEPQVIVTGKETGFDNSCVESSPPEKTTVATDNATNLGVRRSSRAVKHKSSADLENSDFIYDFLPTKRLRTKTIEKPSDESGGETQSVSKDTDSGKQKETEDSSQNKEEDATEKLDQVKSECDSDSPAHTLIELAAAAAAEVEREEQENTVIALDDVLDLDLDDEEDKSQDYEDPSENKPRKSKRVKPKVKVEREYKFLYGSKYTCDSCDSFQTNSVREMTKHMRQHKMEEKICYFCDRPFDEKEALMSHIKEMHQGKMPFACPHCSVRCKTRTQLNLHLPKHSQEKPFICEICSQGFKWKHALKSHMITHSNKKDHLCELCGYATAHRTQLKAHERIHTGETLRCTHPGCTFQATKLQNMKYHQMTHTGEKPHQCEVCGQSFSLKKNMRRHMLMHAGDSKQTCEKCDFHTSRHDKLKEHLLKVHGIGTPPEKRVRVADLVNLSKVFFETKTERSAAPTTQAHTADAGTILTNTVVSSETDGSQMIDNASKYLDKYIIEIENECGEGTHPVHIMPNQAILIAPTDGNGSGGGGVPPELNEIAIAMPSGTVDLDSAALESLTSENTTTVVLSQDGTEMSIADVATGQEDQAEQYQITEVMIPASQVSNLVQQVTYTTQ